MSQERVGPEKYTGERCGPPIVYIEACCRHDEPKGRVRAEMNGHSAASVESVTQILPQVVKVRPPLDEDVKAGRKRHRHPNDDPTGPDMHDLMLGSLIGAGVAILGIGLLTVLLFR